MYYLLEYKRLRTKSSKKKASYLHKTSYYANKKKL